MEVRRQTRYLLQRENVLEMTFVSTNSTAVTGNTDSCGVVLCVEGDVLVGQEEKLC